MAVDVVLLPDEAMMEKAIEINGRLVTEGRPEIVLSKKDCLPHVSLAMGCLDETDIAAVRQRLQGLARTTTVRQLRIVSVVSSVNSRGETTSILQVGNTEELQALHEQVMKEMRPLFHYDVTEATIHDDVVTGSTLDWIRSYPQKASYAHFDPHITIGYGRVPPGLPLPIAFAVPRLALCHLGNHCTCRKVIGEWNVGTME